MSDDSAECPLWGGLSADVSGRSSGPGETADVRLGLIAGDIRRGTPGADTGQLPAMQVSEAARPRGHRVVVQLVTAWPISLAGWVSVFKGSAAQMEKGRCQVASALVQWMR